MIIKNGNLNDVTVAIPTYNGGTYLTKAVKSVIRQTYLAKEILIVDDASKDNTESIVKELQKRCKKQKIKYINNKQNIGYPANWNRCFDLCKTKYLVILHQDDELKDIALESQISFLRKHSKIALVGGLEDGIDINDNIIKTNTRKENRIFQKGQIYEFVTETGSYIPCSSVMFDMEKIRKVGYFDTDVIGTDELFWPKVLTKYPIAILGESLIYRRAHPDQTEYGDFIKYEKEAVEIYKKFQKIIDYEERNEFKGKIKKYLQLKFAISWSGHIAVNVAERRERWIALKYIAKAIRIKPSIVFYFPRMWKSFFKIIIFFMGFKISKYWKT